MSAPDPEAMARILADPATAARMMADPATAARIMADPAFAALCRAPWQPDPCNAPQVQAYTSPADLLLYGGAAGGGKTDLLLGLALTAHERVGDLPPRMCDLSGLTQRLMKILPDRRGYVASPHPRLERDGRLIEFGALEKPGAEQDLAGPAARLHRLRRGRAARRGQGALRDGLAAQHDAGAALPRGDRLQPADRRAGRMAADVVRAVARPGVSASGKAGRIALVLHARRRDDRLGRRAGHAHDRRRCRSRRCPARSFRRGSTTTGSCATPTIARS